MKRFPRAPRVATPRAALLTPLATLALTAAGCAAPAADSPASLAAGGQEGRSWPSFVETTPTDIDAGGLSVERGSIGVSSGGLQIPVYTLAAPGEVEPDRRPAVLIVAGANGQHRTGSEVARELIGAFGETGAGGAGAGGAAALAETTLYIVPMLNPDAFERDGPLDAAVPGGTLTPRDNDRDGRVDEDGPVDLNGDGVITMMRIENPPPGWGLTATKVIDPDEPRLMRDPRPEDGERATHAMHIEGRDQDGDGRIAEDGVGGVDLNRNFPYLWPELEADAGIWPLSEPESLALVDWMLERPNIYAVVVFGPGDTIVNIPAAGQFDQTRRVPTGIETGDKATYERISKIFKEITGQTGAPPPPTIDNRGSLHGWAYGHFGVLTFATPVWVRPDLVTKAEPKGEDNDAAEAGDAAAEPETGDAPEGGGGATAPPETVTIAGRTLTLTPEGLEAARAEYEAASEGEQARLREAVMALPETTRMRFMALMQGEAPAPGEAQAEGTGRGARRAAAGSGSARSGASGSRGGGKSEDAKWLAYSDERGGEGFVEWAPFDHPDLGPVEIGGFRPEFKLNGPPEAIEGLVDEQARFVTRLLEMAPKLVIEEPQFESLGADIWRISLRLRNDGQLATRSAIGVKTRRLVPIVVRLEVADEMLISGSHIERTNAIEPNGATVDHEWIVRAPAGSDMTIAVRTEEWGVFEKTLTLEAGR